MATKNTKGIHQDTDLKGFLISEKRIITSFLSKEWLITRTGGVLHSNNVYRYVIAKPPKGYTELFSLVREFIVLFSPFEEFQPRPLNQF